MVGFDFWRWKFSNNKRVSKCRSKPEDYRIPPLKGSSMVISCPSCKRVFNKPRGVLDLTTGKARLVNVCPYCDAILGNARENEDEKGIETE